MATGVLREPSEQCDQPDDPVQKDPQVAQDHADVVTAAAQDREEGIAGGSLQRASGQAAVGLHVADHRLDGASSSQQFALMYNFKLELNITTDIWGAALIRVTMLWLQTHNQ